MLAHGQFGNWCIQHICEHGAPHDKSRAVEHILLWAVDYSMDQFASKIVEKCLKIGGSEFLDRYLSRVCTGRTDRPRMPLIDSKSACRSPYLEVTLNHISCRRSIWQLFDSMDSYECCTSSARAGCNTCSVSAFSLSSPFTSDGTTNSSKHMVSLRGSKFGSRVAMLCCNLSHSTRPGPGTGVQIGRFSNFSDDRFQAPNQHGGRFGRGGQWNSNYPPFR